MNKKTIIFIIFLSFIFIIVALFSIEFFTPLALADEKDEIKEPDKISSPQRGVVIKEEQEISPESIKPPTTARPELPDYEALRKAPDIVLPPVAPLPEKKEMLSGKLKLFVRKIIFSGNTAITNEELQKISASYENRLITNEELEELRIKLTSLYISKGYINSGVVIPDQKVTDGIIMMQIVEGTLTTIDVSGNTWLRSSYIRNRLALGAKPPFNINNLQERVLLLQDDPRIRRINAELIPGVKPGEAVLNARVEEEKPYQFGFQISNNRSPSIGSLLGEIFSTHRNLTGWGDTLGLRYGATEGANEYSASYLIPLNEYETDLRIYYDASDAKVTEKPFDKIDIRSKLQTCGISISHPFIKTISQELRLSLMGEYRRSETTLLGQPYSFSEGVEDGISTISVVRFSQEWQSRSQVQVFSLRSIISKGVTALGSTDHNSPPDGEFLAWLIQFQYARLFENLMQTQVIFRTDLQMSSDPLLPMEKFSIGGATTVRGYRENQIVRDNAVVSSIELRIPTVRIPLPGMSKGSSDGIVHLAPFFDWGWGSNEDRPTPDPMSICSVGLGIRWNPTSKIQSNLYYGYALKKIDINVPNRDLQDSGIHFQLTTRFF